MTLTHFTIAVDHHGLLGDVTVIQTQMDTGVAGYHLGTYLDDTK